MTDQTPEDRDRELELRDHRAELRARADDLDQDLTAILITADLASRGPLLEAMDADTIRPVALLILDWLDECRNFPEADTLFDDLWLRSRVGLATAPGALADLTTDPPVDEPPC